MYSLSEVVIYTLRPTNYFNKLQVKQAKDLEKL